MKLNSSEFGKKITFYKKEGNFWQISLGEGLEETVKACESNLDLVLPYVEKLVKKKLREKNVISSDYGNAYGEKATLFKIFKIPIYGHPRGVRMPSLIEVPWFEVEKC